MQSRLPAGEGLADTGSGFAATPALRKLRDFGDYELLEEIGQGGMGVVHKARQKSLDRIVALKMLLFGPHAPTESVKRFRAEALATAALHHLNIVGIHEVGLCEGQHFIAMDYVEGPCLSALIHDSPLPARRAAGYVRAIAQAIHHAHEHGILHRDLKPANVLVDASDEPRVSDFGLAKRLEGDSQMTVSGQVLGSPNYMPPEQAAGKRGTVSRRIGMRSKGSGNPVWPKPRRTDGVGEPGAVSPAWRPSARLPPSARRWNCAMKRARAWPCWMPGSKAGSPSIASPG